MPLHPPPPRRNFSFEIGRAGESVAAGLYERHRFQIVSRNFQNRRGRKFGEIDFIAYKQQCLHFVEVKTRTVSERQGVHPAELLTLLKRRRLVLTAKYFLLLHPEYSQCLLRFDYAVVQLRSFDKAAERITIYSDCIEET